MIAGIASKPTSPLPFRGGAGGGEDRPGSNRLVRARRHIPTPTPPLKGRACWGTGTATGAFNAARCLAATPPPSRLRRATSPGKPGEELGGSAPPLPLQGRGTAKRWRGFSVPTHQRPHATLARLLLLLTLLLAPVAASAQAVPLTALGRFDGWRENALIGYGLVTGLAGTGDTRRSVVTRQALRNVLSRLGTNVADDQISSRNVAVVMVTARLPASANVGDRIDANISSIGDARSLAGGTLIMTPLLGPDQRTYALAQGLAADRAATRFDSDLNSRTAQLPHFRRAGRRCDDRGRPSTAPS